MNKLILVAFAVATSVWGASTAYALPIHYVGGSGWGCKTCGFTNGTQLTGIAPEFADRSGAAFEAPAFTGIEVAAIQPPAAARHDEGIVLAGAGWFQTRPYVGLRGGD